MIWPTCGFWILCFVRFLFLVPLFWLQVCEVGKRNLVVERGLVTGCGVFTWNHLVVVRFLDV